jgi:hypothetical protein
MESGSTARSAREDTPTARRPAPASPPSFAAPRPGGSRSRRNTLEQLRNAQEQLRLAQQAQEQNQKTTQAQLENARKELDITRRGQITERFAQAIDQLGSNSLEIRLGGIYSLERTARDSRSDHWPVMEVLTAYVRKHTSWKLKKDSAEGNVPTPEPDIPRRVNTIDRRTGHTPEPDIQAILTVIGRRPEYHRRGTFEDSRKIEYGPIDLHDTDLRGAHLGAAHLEGARLDGPHLEGAYLVDTHLEGAVDLTPKQLEWTVGSEKTELPEYLVDRRPAAWSKSINEQLALLGARSNAPSGEDQ